MPLRRLFEAARPLPGAPGIHAVIVTAKGWREAALDLAAAGGRLVALWASGDAATRVTVHAAIAAGDGVLVLDLEVAGAHAMYPRLDDIFPAADRMQRAAADMSGVRALGANARPWLRHAAWPGSHFPLTRMETPAAPAAPAQPATPAQSSAPEIDDYAFVRVEGDGVHEIPVGPVHAGIIEPGHFRFSIVGEKVLKLEERLGYVHKGIERRFTELPLLEGPPARSASVGRLRGRVFVGVLPGARRSRAGAAPAASRVAACARARTRADREPPGRPRRARQRCRFRVRLEPVLAAQGTAAARHRAATRPALPARLRRRRRHTRRPCARWLAGRWRPTSARCADEVRHLQDIYDEHAGVRDRFVGTGVVTPELASQLGLTGLAGRASGQAFDLRVDLPCEPYTALAPVKSGRLEGDVAARVSRAIRRAAGILPARPGNPAHACRQVRIASRSHRRRTAAGPSASSRAGAGRCSWRWTPDPRVPSAVAIRTIRPGRTGRCSSTRSSATSSRIFR